jgi:hypothetical protein
LDRELELLPGDKPPAVDITYNLLLFSTLELNRPVTRRKPIAAYLVLKSDMVWEDFYAQLKNKVCDSLFPGQPLVNKNSFEMTFSIPRHVTNPLKIISAADYAYLLANIAKMKTNPNAKIVIESRAPNLVGV